MSPKAKSLVTKPLVLDPFGKGFPSLFAISRWWPLSLLGLGSSMVDPQPHLFVKGNLLPRLCGCNFLYAKEQPRKKYIARFEPKSCICVLRDSTEYKQGDTCCHSTTHLLSLLRPLPTTTPNNMCEQQSPFLQGKS